MTKNKTISVIIVLTFLVSVGWFLKNNNESTADLSPKQKKNTQRKSSQGRVSFSQRSEESSNLQNKLLVEKALTNLAKSLPSWMNEKGMTFEDQREIFGHTVLRSRIRHEWEEGKQMEIEISDLGLGANENVIKALGFDLKMEEMSDDSGVNEVDDNEDQVISNYEYHYADQAGSLQVLFGSRYFIEIQLQGLPENSFQEILDQDIAFDELYKTAPLGE